MIYTVGVAYVLSCKPIILQGEGVICTAEGTFGDIWAHFFWWSSPGDSTTDIYGSQTHIQHPEGLPGCEM